MPTILHVAHETETSTNPAPFHFEFLRTVPSYMDASTSIVVSSYLTRRARLERMRKLMALTNPMADTFAGAFSDIIFAPIAPVDVLTSAVTFWREAAKRVTAATQGEVEARTAYLATMLKPTFDKLDELAALKADWDSYGAKPISEHGTKAARRLVTAVALGLYGLVGSRALPYHVVPSPDGGIGLEWRSIESSIEVDINPDGSLGYLIVRDRADGPEYAEVDGVTRADTIAAIADVLVAGRLHARSR